MSRRMNESHVYSVVVDAIALCLASTLDLDTVGCFLTLHDMQFEPRNVEYPVVEHFMDGQLPQSALEKAYKSRELFRRMQRPMDIVTLRYQRIRFTIWKGAFIAACMCWHTVFTA